MPRTPKQSRTQKVARPAAQLPRQQYTIAVREPRAEPEARTFDTHHEAVIALYRTLRHRPDGTRAEVKRGRRALGEYARVNGHTKVLASITPWL